eukprot:137315_1
MIRKTVMMNAQQHQQLLNLVKNQNNTNNIINQQSSAPHNNNENNWTYTANTHRGPGLIDSKSRIGSTPIYNQFNNYNQLYRGQSTRGTSIGDAVGYTTPQSTRTNIRPQIHLQTQTQQQQMMLTIFQSLTVQQKIELINVINLKLLQQPNNNNDNSINNINNSISKPIIAMNKLNVLPNSIIENQSTEPLATSRSIQVTDDIIKTKKNKKDSLSFIPRSHKNTERTSKNIKNTSKSLLKDRIAISKRTQKLPLMIHRHTSDNTNENNNNTETPQSTNKLLNLVKNQNNTNNIINQQSSAPHNNNENNW